MDITSKTKTKIVRILNAIESGDPDGDYGKVSIFEDGPGNIEQITYGTAQTTEFGNLKKLIELYISKRGNYADDFKDYVDSIGQKPSLAANNHFIELLQNSADDPIMMEAQDEFFDSHYWSRAYKWAITNGFKHPLSMLVIYDSYVHSGSILSFLRKRFSARPPAAGGSEKEWIKQYVSARHNWLATHRTRPILRKTIYRTRMLRQEILDDNWSLSGQVNANGAIVD